MSKAPSRPSIVGPAGVGTGSLAGMRALHHLSDIAHIWPFDDAATASRPLHLVEIFPSHYFALAGIRVNGPMASAKTSIRLWPILGLIRYLLIFRRTGRIMMKLMRLFLRQPTLVCHPASYLVCAC